jgi:hypothetical protein
MTDFGINSKREKSDLQQISDIREYKQQICTLEEIKNIYFENIQRLEKEKLELERLLRIEKHQSKEYSQELSILNDVKQSLTEKLLHIENELDAIKSTSDETIKNEKELVQQKLLSEQIESDEHKTRLVMSKKFYIVISLMAIIASSIFIAYSFYENTVFLETAKNVLGTYKTGYLIQNLKGDTVNTWVSWAIIPDRILSVQIVNSAGLSDDKISVVKDAILSEKQVKVDDSLLHKGPQGSFSEYYVGWKGALEKASETKTQLYIPVKFDVLATNTGTGDIVVTLSKDENPDGLSGLTKSVSDQHEILRSTITIFHADTLTAEQLNTITRHEFGHAMGLAHSSDPDDLMHATIQTAYPYVSECDINAINSLYDGNQKSDVVCTK